MKMREKLKEIKKRSLSKIRRTELIRDIRQKRSLLSSSEKTYLEEIGLYNLIFSGHDSSFESNLDRFDFKSDIDFDAGGNFGGGGASSGWDSDSSSSSSSSSSSWSSSDSSSSSDSGSSSSDGGGGGGGD